MKFRTADLIARIDTLLAEREKAVAAAKVKAERESRASEARWVEAHGEAFLEFAATVRTKVRKGQPITRDDVPEKAATRYSDSLAFYFAPREQDVVEPGSLLTLKAALEAVEDEFVTTTGLREIGFKDIARYFRPASA